MKSLQLSFAFFHSRYLCIHSSNHVQRCSFRRQAQAVSQHLCCAELPSSIFVVEVSRCYSSHANLTSIRGEPDKQAILDFASTQLWLHQHLLVEEHPQETPVGRSRCCREAHPIQGNTDCPLCDSDREPRRVLWQAHQDLPRGATMDCPRMNELNSLMFEMKKTPSQPLTRDLFRMWRGGEYATRLARPYE